MADRRDRRTIIARDVGALALAVLALAVLSRDTDTLDLGGILAIVFLTGVAAASSGRP